MRPTPPNSIPRLRRYGILNLDSHDNTIFMALMTRVPILAALTTSLSFKRQMQRLRLMDSRMWTASSGYVVVSHLCRHPEFALVSIGGKYPVYELVDHPTTKDELCWRKIATQPW